MFTMASCFGLRVGEITKSSHNLNMSHLELSSSAVTITFTSFKHSHDDPFSHTCNIRDSPLCPVTAMNKYIQVRGVSLGPVFQLSGKALSRQAFTSRLKTLLISSGEPQAKYNSHSFRIGAASRWASEGKSDIEIQRLGRWQSNAFRKYLRSTVVHS